MADREIDPDRAYNRSTRWVCSSLLLAWLGTILITAVLAPHWWIQSVFVGAFVLGLPAYVISSYRGLGYTSVVAVARLDSVSAPELQFDGVTPSTPLKVTIGVGWVHSRQPMGRNLGGRRITSVERRPDLDVVLDSIYKCWNRGNAGRPRLVP
ncbi:MAG: hypothetical protein L3K18_07515 [Thermoplasmata archaeon]|nr:hypothetical protein [Thermoplasmata archaeon]